MSKKVIISIAIAVVILLLGAVSYLYVVLRQANESNQQLQELAALEKKEMENEYTQFAVQYDELKRSIRNDSLMHRLIEEENKTKSLLEELRKTKSDDAREISRLKKELATVRAVLRSYIIQVDSLNRLNESLKNENAQVRQQYTEATAQISNLTSEKQNLSNQVAIASQLDATGVSLVPQSKKGKSVKKTKDVARFVVSFKITRNITAKTGERKIYVRVTQPNNSVVGQCGTFAYESSTIGYSAVKTIEYTGEETQVTAYVNVNEMLMPGTFKVYVFAEGNMIGSGSLTMEK